MATVPFVRLAQNPAEPLVLQAIRVCRRIDPLLRQVLQDDRVRPCVPRLLLDERLDGLLQLLVVDQRTSLVHDVYEPTLAGREKQVQNVDDVGREGVTRHPVPRSTRPVEANPAGLGRVSFLYGVSLYGRDFI